jgi:hypothetical protein
VISIKIAPKELDIFIPSKRIAIEYCGLYWHSEKKVDKKYHYEKYLKCAAAGVRLIQIFEDEWIQQQDICKSRIRHAVGLTDQSVFARKCTIAPISGADYKAFVNKHHIQGYVPATIKVGAFYQNKLVAVMSFGSYRPIYRKKVAVDEYELLRFCANGNIPGIASRLLKYFEQHYRPQKVVSYCDLRWGTGVVYERLGFEYSHHTGLNYWYTNNGVNRYHRSKFTKSKISNTNTAELSEATIMAAKNYYRIWDCGNSCFIKNYG